MRKVLRANRLPLFSPHDLRMVICLVRELDRAALPAPLYRAAVVKRIGNLINAEGGAFHKSTCPASCHATLSVLHQEAWSATDTERLLHQLNQIGIGRLNGTRSLLTAATANDFQPHRHVHYIFSIEASDAGVHLILSFKRFSHPFCDREAVLVQTLHHSFLSSDEGPSRTTLGDLLSVRKTQVLTHLLGGKSEKEIATELRISPHTVHVHVKWLYRKYAVNSRAELISRSLLSASDALDEPKLSSMSRADKKSELIAGSPA